MKVADPVNLREHVYNILRSRPVTELIIDDEEYFTLSCGFISGNKGFYTEKGDSVPVDVKFIGKPTFEEKVA
ncbi:hypothetical protein QE152_g30118 [Popillia japonica]|uniref:Uncharacterized protein n=1 Tax=Popillia japonica TaxID=7064 RepID=A0AAW1JFM9_POPJA